MKGRPGFPCRLTRSFDIPLARADGLAHDKRMHTGSDVFDAAVRAALERWHLPLEQSGLDLLHAHFEAVVEASRVMNLTRITDPVEAAAKHYADSLSVVLWVVRKEVRIRTVLDVGTGAGFPALPLAVMRADWLVTALDATKKKVEFLRRAAGELGVGNLRCEHAHSVHWRPGHRFDLVLCRALAPLPKAVSQTARHVAVGGYLVAYKTVLMKETEATQARKTALELDLHPEPCFSYSLLMEGEELSRTLHIFRRSAE